MTEDYFEVVVLLSPFLDFLGGFFAFFGLDFLVVVSVGGFWPANIGTEATMAAMANAIKLFFICFFSLAGSPARSHFPWWGFPAGNSIAPVS
jgi:hypothetical protein